MFAQSITAQGDCVVLKVERKQFTVLVGKANTLLERNREMYDMVKSGELSKMMQEGKVQRKSMNNRGGEKETEEARDTNSA